MKKQEADVPGTNNRDSYLLGRRMCIFSSFMLALAVVALVLYVPDNIYTAAFAQAPPIPKPSIATFCMEFFLL